MNALTIEIKGENLIINGGGKDLIIFLNIPENSSIKYVTTPSLTEKKIKLNGKIHLINHSKKISVN